MEATCLALEQPANAKQLDSSLVTSLLAHLEPLDSVGLSGDYRLESSTMAKYEEDEHSVGGYRADDIHSVGVGVSGVQEDDHGGSHGGSHSSGGTHDSHSSDSHSSDSHSADSHSADSHSSDSHSADSHSADSHSVGSHEEGGKANLLRTV